MKKFFSVLKQEQLDKLYYKSVYKKLNNLILKEIYLQYKKELEKLNLINQVQDKTIYNSSQNKSALYLAIESNKITYQNSLLKGNFSDKVREEIKSLGGVYNRATNGYYFFNIPIYLKLLLKTKEKQRKQAVASVLVLSAAIYNNFISKQEKLSFNQELTDLHNELQSKLNKEVNSQFSTSLDNFKQKYSENIKIKIKDFTNSELTKVRNNVIKVIQSGGNDQDIKNILNKNYNLNSNRVERIAKQEINLATKLYQYEFLQATGNDLFYWIHTHKNDESAREEHIEFSNASDNGRVFSYSNLPINPNTGLPDAPGILPNCRCLARFVVAKR